MTDMQKQNIKDLRGQGLSYSRIADTLELSVNTVKSYCQRQKLPVGEPPCDSHEEHGHVCKQCGKPLERTSRAKTFCCDKCRYDYWNAHQDRRRSVSHTICAYCGKVFASYGSRHRKYCGHPCYIKGRFLLCQKEGIPRDQRAI